MGQNEQVVGKPVLGADQSKKKKDKGKKGAELPGTGATGSGENKDEETAAKHIQDAFNKDGAMCKFKSEPPASKAIKATGKKKAKGKTAKTDELAPHAAVGSSENQGEQVVGTPVLGADQGKKKKKEKVVAHGAKGCDENQGEELAATQIQDAWTKSVEKNLEKKEELPAIKAIGCNDNQDEQVVGKPV